MTKKADFNAEEWSLISTAPAIAGMIVATAERGGTLRESVSIGRVYGTARRETGESELVAELAGTMPDLKLAEFRSAEEVRTGGAQKLREAVALVEQKGTSEEADAYRRFIVELARQVAESHKEGGFIGIGGKPVSDREALAIDEVRAAVGA